VEPDALGFRKESNDRLEMDGIGHGALMLDSENNTGPLSSPSATKRRILPRMTCRSDCNRLSIARARCLRRHLSGMLGCASSTFGVASQLR
jgi:hypothetical protein